MEHFLFLRVVGLNLPSVPSHDNTMILLTHFGKIQTSPPPPLFSKEKSFIFFQFFCFQDESKEMRHSRFWVIFLVLREREEEEEVGVTKAKFKPQRGFWLLSSHLTIDNIFEW
jgi:hypothetical protein